MAPKVLSGKAYDEKADVFSYGIVVCEIISRLDADPDEIPRMKVNKHVQLLWLLLLISSWGMGEWQSNAVMGVCF